MLNSQTQTSSPAGQTPAAAGGSSECPRTASGSEPRRVPTAAERPARAGQTTAPEPWQRALASAIRDPDVLLRELDLPGELLEPARRASQLFPLLVPRTYLRRIRKGDPGDPLLRQVLPIEAERQEVEGFVSDPVGDRDALTAPGLLQKYAGRALLVVSGTCAVHCRFCFRRMFPYDEQPRRPEQWQPALERLRRDRQLREVVLSGGDPLVLSDERLRELVQLLESIGHLRRLRLHTRLPIVVPQRVTGELVQILTTGRLKTVVVVHTNHPQELDESCAEALRCLTRSGVTVLSQSVLLRGVNDDVEVLSELCERLVELGVLPYYLHQLDRVQGAAHFEVDEGRGRELVEQLRRRLPGYAVPRYVREVAGREYKVPLA